MPFTTLTLRYEWSANVMDTTWVSDDVYRLKFLDYTVLKITPPIHMHH